MLSVLKDTFMFFQQLLDAKRRQGEEELKVLELQTRLKAKLAKEKEAKKEGGEESLKDKEEVESEVDTTDSLLVLSSKLTEKEAKLIGIKSLILTGGASSNLLTFLTVFCKYFIVVVNWNVIYYNILYLNGVFLEINVADLRILLLTVGLKQLKSMNK